MNPRTLQGMSVVALAEAERIGRVSDVLFDTDPLRMAALTIDGADEDRLIPLDRIRRIGPDAITAETADVVGRPRRTEEDAHRRGTDMPRRRHDARRLGLDDLAKLKVVDEEGELVGQITSLDVDPETGEVDGVDVRRGDVLGIGGETFRLEPEAILSVGPELLTTRAPR